jgi:hypothetical protein
VRASERGRKEERERERERERWRVSGAGWERTAMWSAEEER